MHYSLFQQLSTTNQMIQTNDYNIYIEVCMSQWFFERAEQLKYLATTLTNQNSVQEENKSTLKSGNASLFPFTSSKSTHFFSFLCTVPCSGNTHVRANVPKSALQKATTSSQNGKLVLYLNCTLVVPELYLNCTPRTLRRTLQKGHVTSTGTLWIQVFWNVTHCHWVSVSRRFEGV
jgi:hypothetical protein